MIRELTRRALRAWNESEIAPGYLYRAIEALGTWTGAGCPLSSVLPNGCVVECDLSEHIMRLIYFLGCYEPISCYVFTRLIMDGMVFIDAGANVGQYTLLASTMVGASGSVHSFEPIPSNFTRLRRHVESNGLTNVHLNQLALWRETSVLTLGIALRGENNAGLYSARSDRRQDVAIQVECVRLDDYAQKKRLNRVDLIKMDIEGAEPCALAGGLALLKEFHPLIIMEVNRPALEGSGSSPAALWHELSRLGYRAWHIGQSAAQSGPLSDLEGVQEDNVLLYHGKLPREVTQGWNYHTALRWARSGWASALAK